MPATHNGEVEIHYETFGDPERPTLLLVNGLGSQCINYSTEWCEMFAAEGYHVVRFDNRDVGLSSKLPDVDYALVDMADDAIAVLDAVGVDRAHVMGCSMGGMIVQRLAIDHPERLHSMTSVMSRTGEPGFGDSSEEALAILMTPPPVERAAYIERQVEAHRVYGSKPEWLDEDAIARRAATAYDRCFYPDGIRHQMMAVGRDGSRSEQLAALDLPVLVIHGSRDTLIDPSGGRRTAELIPGARYVEIEGMGHDYPVAVWRQWVDAWAEFARTSAAPVG
jgi:pimeloyl-ACP methyl ester carboxylesterase